jgi:hypothetical protein
MKLILIDLIFSLLIYMMESSNSSKHYSSRTATWDPTCKYQIHLQISLQTGIGLLSFYHSLRPKLVVYGSQAKNMGF